MWSLFLQQRFTKRTSLSHLCLCNTAPEEPETLGWPLTLLPYPRLGICRNKLSASLPASLGTRWMKSTTQAGCAASQLLV